MYSQNVLFSFAVLTPQSPECSLSSLWTFPTSRPQILFEKLRLETKCQIEGKKVWFSNPLSKQSQNMARPLTSSESTNGHLRQWFSRRTTFSNKIITQTNADSSRQPFRPLLVEHTTSKHVQTHCYVNIWHMLHKTYGIWLLIIFLKKWRDLFHLILWSDYWISPLTLKIILYEVHVTVMHYDSPFNITVIKLRTCSGQGIGGDKQKENSTTQECD